MTGLRIYSPGNIEINTDSGGEFVILLNNRNVLAELDALAKSTATITVSNGTRTSGRLAKSGNTVTISLVTSGTSVTTSMATIGTVPSGFRPASAAARGIGLAGYTPIKVQVTTGGNIQIQGEAAIASADVQFNLAWVI